MNMQASQIELGGSSGAAIAGAADTIVVWCTGCNTRFQVVSTHGAADASIRYCVQCGASTVMTCSVIVQGTDASADPHIVALAAEYGYPVDIMAVLYADWNTREYQSFADYILSVRRDLATAVSALAES